MIFIKYIRSHGASTHLTLDILEVCSHLIRLAHRAVQSLVWLRIHVANDTLHEDIAGSMDVRVNLNRGVPIFLRFIVSARFLIFLVR